MSSPNRVALITGASSGIGRASAIALSAAGWHVVLTGRRADALAETAKECTGAGTKYEVVAGDIGDQEFVKTLFARTLEVFGRLDLLFNNAGTGAPAVPIEDLDVNAFLNVVNTNLVAPFLCTREAVRIFKQQTPTGGRIINNGSISAHTPRPNSVPYTTTKHAITGLTKSTQLDGRKYGITCTQIDIGNAATPLSARLSSLPGATQPDGTQRPEASFDVSHVANSVVHIAGLPTDVTVLELVIMATEMPYVGRG
ncbi:hypothetical protein PLICRDRAFT_114181 [Plicaturopsis crispa FD-325 SS-3]|nr:hypothetical protein PLICRDRAFT_114181 [Plicaturopsis crispa FD-325 SS-3]